MPTKRIITVFGATGAQGGGVVSTFFNDFELNTKWTVRAVTRDASKDSAKKLAEQGVNVVEADLNDPGSLVQAVKGSDAVFGVTNYWEKASAELEVEQGKNLANAVKEASVGHYIWSSLLNITTLSDGKLPNVYHFDSKAKVEEYVRELGIPATFFMPGFYMTTFPKELFKPQPPENHWTLALPVTSSAAMPIFHPRDTGKYVKAILLNAEENLGKRILAATDYVTMQEVVDGFAKVFPVAGESARFFQVPEDIFRGMLKGKELPDYVVDELYENLRLAEEFGYFGGTALDHGFVKDHLTTWVEYAQEAEEFKGLE
ncbi:NmrA-like family-domain-containing protein [Hypoxylon cercidicola]|nr:NmrA-like family-domain-containing protein [Hypoxylon cercidicola]